MCCEDLKIVDWATNQRSTIEIVQMTMGLSGDRICLLRECSSEGPQRVDCLPAHEVHLHHPLRHWRRRDETNAGTGPR